MKELIAACFLVGASFHANSETLFGIPFGTPSSSVYKVCTIKQIGGDSYCLVDKGRMHKGVLYASLNLDPASVPAWAEFGHFEAEIVNKRVIEKITVTTSPSHDCDHIAVISSISKRFGPPANSQRYANQGGWQASWARGEIRTSLLKLTSDYHCVVTFTAPGADARDLAARIEQSKSAVRPISP